MASLKQILEIEASSQDNVINLHRSGIFLEAFNRSAKLLLEYCKVNYKLNYRFSHELDAAFASVGFPMKSLDTLFKAGELQVSGDGYHIETPLHFSQEEVQAFILRAKQEFEAREKEKAAKAQQPAANATQAGTTAPAAGAQQPGGQPARQASSYYPPNTREIIARLRHFDLANATPIDCMMLIVQLQKLLFAGTAPAH